MNNSGNKAEPHWGLRDKARADSEGNICPVTKVRKSTEDHGGLEPDRPFSDTYLKYEKRISSLSY